MRTRTSCPTRLPDGSGGRRPDLGDPVDFDDAVQDPRQCDRQYIRADRQFIYPRTGRPHVDTGDPCRGHPRVEFLRGPGLESLETALLRVPGVRAIYSTFKSVTDIFSFLDQRRENRVVLIPFPREGLYAIGLLIGDAPEELQGSPFGRFRIVFVPTAPHPFTGYFALVLHQDVIPLLMGFHDAIKMEFSCGLYLPPVSYPALP